MINEKNLNYEEWIRNCQKFKHNRDGLNFKTNFSVEDGHMVIAFNDVDEKYVPALKQLAFACAHGAIAYMSNTIIPTYAFKEDMNEEYDKCNQIVKDNAEELLKILFRSDVDTFAMYVSVVKNIVATRYELQHLSLMNGKFVYESKQGKYIWNGSVLEDINKEDVLITPWSNILPECETLVQNQKFQDQEKSIA